MFWNLIWCLFFISRWSTNTLKKIFVQICDCDPFRAQRAPFQARLLNLLGRMFEQPAQPKVNDRNTRARWELCSKLTIKTPERGQVDTGWVPIPTDSFKILSEQYLQNTCVTVYSNKNQECSTEMLVFILVDSYHWLSSSLTHGGRESLWFVFPPQRVSQLIECFAILPFQS